MNYAEPAGSSPMLSQDMAFLRELFDKLKGFLQDSIHALDQMDRATAQGKALDQLRERMIGSHIKAEICVADASSMLHQNGHEVNVRVVTPEPLPQEVQFHIHQMLAAVNLRCAITIRAEFMNRQEK
jgi:hypothetical protein